MLQTATITSKRQLTIPVALFRAAGYKKGQQVMVRRLQNKLVIEPASNLIDTLAGSVSVPARLRHLTSEQLVGWAKKTHFSKRK